MSGLRLKRSVDGARQREITCESLFGGSALYWKYDYEVPASCWSKYQYQHHQYITHLNLAGVNCTKSDLDVLLAARSDVEILELENQLWYSKTYK